MCRVAREVGILKRGGKRGLKGGGQESVLKRGGRRGVQGWRVSLAFEKKSGESKL